MKNKIARLLTGVISAIAAYLIVGAAVHYYLMPMGTPDYANCFAPGDRFYSASEGFAQTILSKSDGWVKLRLEIDPRAPGPPTHLHTGFDETFKVKKGTLSFLLNGEKKTLHEGETFTVPRGVSHRPFNETDEVVVIEDDRNERTVSEKFAYHLSQLYPFVDAMGTSPSNISIMMQFAVYGDEMDAWIADGPPVNVQRAMRYLLAPTARLLGYRNYYPQYALKHPGQ